MPTAATAARVLRACVGCRRAAGATLPRAACPRLRRTIMDGAKPTSRHSFVSVAAVALKNNLAVAYTLGASVSHALQANWAPCSHDTDCASQWCGCNGGSSRVCLPSTATPKSCPNWTSCDHDNECQSSWCGCNGAATKQCLPSTSYPKACPNLVLCDHDNECQSSWCGCNGTAIKQCLPAGASKSCANWVLCDHDNECQSTWCGCNGGATKQCLPSTAYQKGCANWVLCDHDNECQSNWCGSNGTAAKQCLPSTSYPKACAASVLCAHDNECQSNWCGWSGTAIRRCLANTSYPKSCANWVLCDADSECQSSWCGCNGGPSPQCLPSTAYPKACPVAAWPLDACGGLPVSDSSISNATGTRGGGNRCTYGRVDNAGLFDKTDYVSIPDRSSFHFTTAMSVTAWVKPASLGGSPVPTILNKSTGLDSYVLGTNSSGFFFGVPFLRNGSIVLTSVSAAGTVDEWTHLVGVYDGANVKLYKNGVLAASTPASGSMTLNDPSQAVTIGRYFSGRLDRSE